MLHTFIISEELKIAIKIEMLCCFQAAVTTALGRTKSAVSMMWAHFEDHIGEALFQTARKSC
jgi:hypothetical protein